MSKDVSVETLTVEDALRAPTSQHNESAVKTTETLTIMPDGGGAYIWSHNDDPSNHLGVGQFSGLPMVRRGMRMHPHPLTKEFEEWQAYWERNWTGYMDSFDWKDFHAEGIALARKLKKSVGEKYRIVYEKPCEDPDHDTQSRREILLDGRLIDLPSPRTLRERAGSP